MFFSYGHENGIEFHETAEASRRKADPGAGYDEHVEYALMDAPDAGTEARRVAVASGALLADESKGGGQ